MRRTLVGLQNPGVQTASGENLVDLEYADDVVLAFEEEEKAQVYLDEHTKVIRSFGMHFAPIKCSVMLVDMQSLNTTLAIQGEALEVVERFNYLGSCISSDYAVTDEVHKNALALSRSPWTPKSNKYIRTYFFSTYLLTRYRIKAISGTRHPKPYVIPRFLLPGVNMLSPPAMVTCDFHTFINDKNSERFFLEFLAGDTKMNIYQSIYDFWVMCHKYQSTFGHSSPEEASKLAHQIIRTYVTHEVDRDYQINYPFSAASSHYIDESLCDIRGILSEQTLTKLLDTLNKNTGLSANLFEKAQLEVEDYLRNFVYPYFIKSDHYKQYTMAHIHSDKNPEYNDGTSRPVSGISTHEADSNLSDSPNDELDRQWCGAFNSVLHIHSPSSPKSSTESPSVVIKNRTEGSPNGWEELSALDWSPNEMNIQAEVENLSVEEAHKEAQMEQASNKNSETVADGALEDQLKATRSAAFDLHSSLASFSWAQALFAQSAREELSQPIRAESILDHHLSRVWRKRARCMLAEDRLERQERRMRERSPEETLPTYQVGRYPSGYTPHLDLRLLNHLQCKMDLKGNFE
ncbi:axin-1 [Clonorchis sinensis]|uniref:Axin-1 n=1 Tax=Clonorchis sinensis TaxID=79923 RepID=G7Y328_CLOSI|nr:axin-1 [Clonorchis sinensis]